MNSVGTGVLARARSFYGIILSEAAAATESKNPFRARIAAGREIST